MPAGGSILDFTMSMSEASLDHLRAWDPTWAALYERVAVQPWQAEVLPHKLSALILVALNASCTARNTDGTRTAIRAALQAGASRDEVLSVLKMAALLAIHSCSLGAPLLLAELAAAHGAEAPPPTVATPACDAMREIGQWNAAWDPFFELDPVWTDEFMATGAALYASGILPAKEVELLSIAFDASYTHMYAPGTRRHIEGALTAGASVAEITEVLKLCVAQDIQACNLGISILAEELAVTNHVTASTQKGNRR